jgi:hypothetical protein
VKVCSGSARLGARKDSECPFAALIPFLSTASLRARYGLGTTEIFARSALVTSAATVYGVARSDTTERLSKVRVSSNTCFQSLSVAR